MGLLRGCLLFVALTSLLSLCLYSFTVEDAVKYYKDNNSIDGFISLVLDNVGDTEPGEASKIILYSLHIWFSEESYNKILQINYRIEPEEPLYYNCMIYRAKSLKEKGLTEDAYEIYQETILKSGDAVLIRESLTGIMELIRKGIGLERLEELRGLISDYEWYPEFDQYIKGFIYDQYYQKKEYLKALEGYLQLYKENPGRYNRGRINLAVKRISREKLESLNQNILLIYYIENGDYDKALRIIEDLKRRRKRMPYYGRVLAELGNVIKYTKNAEIIYRRIERISFKSAKKYYSDIFRKYPCSSFAEKALFMASAGFIKNKEYDKAADLYIMMEKKRFFSKNYELFIIRNGILSIMSENLDRAKQCFLKLSRIKNNDYSAIGKYFLAKIYIGENMPDKAKQIIYDSIVNNHNTYYSLKAEELHKKLPDSGNADSRIIRRLINTSEINTDTVIKYSQALYRLSTSSAEKRRYKENARQNLKIYTEYLVKQDEKKLLEMNDLYVSKYRDLSETGDYEIINPYISYLYKKYDNAAIDTEYIRLLYENGQNLRAIAVCTALINRFSTRPDIRLLPDIYREVLFPVRFLDIIEKNTDYENTDPLIIKSLIRQESGFNRYAVSHRNAMGLMQILPSTARQVAKKHGIGYRGSHDLFDEEVNISIGIKYFETLIKKYKNVNYALSAYNAGSRNADRWIGMYDGEDMDIYNFIVTYRETRDYVQLILRNYMIYRSIIYDE